MRKKLFCLLSVSCLLALGACDQGGSSTSNSGTSIQPSTGLKERYNCIDISEALEIASKASEPTQERYYLYGKITSVSNYDYGSMEIEDETGKIYIYGTYSEDGSVQYKNLEYKPNVNDEIVIYATLQTHSGQPEVKNAWLIDYVDSSTQFDVNEYEKMTIAKAREAEKGKKVLVSGVVSRKTYATGKKENGFYLVDNTSSIYVYDSSTVSKVEEGNTITLAATKDYWILEKEESFAKKYGYNGSCQLTKGHIVSNDKGNNNIDTSWVEETTIKNIMDTPVTENITNKIFKANAYIVKSQKEGYVNYYIDDLDETTGSYVYTQCNGSDLDWLEEFNGKICTVLVVAINAKSTISGCSWRFIPISVKDEGFTFDKANVGQFIYDYNVKTLFEDVYTGDPKIVVPVTASSSLLGFENASISYSSNNEKVAYFSEDEGALTFHTNEVGNAAITVKINYENNAAFVKTFNVSVTLPDVTEFITVKEAIDSELNSIVTVKGIAGPSLVNKVGFYLIDESGAIAITTSSETISSISLGNEVILKGTRSQLGVVQDKSVGEIFLDNCELVSNLYGKHDYSTASFDSSKTLADLAQIKATEDATAQVYVFEGTFEKVVQPKYSNMYVKNGDTKIRLYCSNAAQYGWLDEFVDQTVTIEMALCNWNGKTYYTGCVLSVTVNGVKTMNTLVYNQNN